MLSIRSLRAPALVAASYLLLTLVFTYPLCLHLATRHVGDAQGDARIYLWNLWWVKAALTRLHTDPLQTDFIFFPTGIGLALHTLALSHGLLFIPLSAMVGDVAAANVIVLATFLASAMGAYALSRHLGAGREGAFLAGLIFAFCPSRLARLAGHYDLLSTEWIPLYALAFLKTMEAPRLPVKWMIAAALLGAGCGYTDLTYLVFLALVSLLLLGLAPRSTRFTAVLVRAGVVPALVGVLLAPLLVEAWRDSTAWHYPPYPGSDRYVADLLAYVTPGPLQTFMGPRLGHAFDSNVTETTVFAGWVTVALLVASFFARVDGRARRPWIVIGGGAFVLSLGDTLHVAGRDTGWPLLFPLLQRLPVLHHLRAPSRFSILVMLSFGLLVALAWTRWLGRVRTPASRLVVTGAAALLMACEFLAIPIPLFASGVPALFERIRAEPGDFTVVEVPGIDQAAAQVMYRQTFHEKRIFIGTVARVPVEKTGYFFGLPLVRPLVDLRKGRMRLDDALASEVTAPCGEAARFLGIRYFVVENAYDSRQLVPFLEAALPVERVEGDREHVVLRVRPEALPPIPWRIDAAGPASRLYFESGWSSPEGPDGGASRSATRLRSTLLFRRPASAGLRVRLRVFGEPGWTVRGRLGNEFLGRSSVPPAGDVEWEIPAGPAERVERLELLWSARGTRIAQFQLERR